MHRALPSILSTCIIAMTAGIVAPARADGVAPDQATAVQREQAQARFARGKELFKDGKYAEALTELQASHEIVSSPNTRLMIARCYQELGRLVEAYAEFGRTSVEARELERADRRYRQAAETAEQERQALESRLAFVTVDVQHAQPGTSLKVGGELIRPAAWGEPTPALPGSAEVVVDTPGHGQARKTVQVQAGQRTSVSIDALAGDSAPPSPVSVGAESTAPSMRTWAYVAGGVGLAGIATFAVAGSMANSTYNDLDSACGGGPCPPDRKSDIDAGRRDQTIANIGLAVGVIGVGAGVTLYVLSKRSSSSPSAALVVSPTWAGIQGRM